MDNLQAVNKVLRSGKTVDMEAFLGELDSRYLYDLKATIGSFETYDEVSNETYGDLYRTIGKLEILLKLGYLSKEEYDAMVETAQDMRKVALKELEHENS